MGKCYFGLMCGRHMDKIRQVVADDLISSLYRNIGLVKKDSFATQQSGDKIQSVMFD